eukprot:TRINITY_DN20531_c0_g2_i1.p1 TRINITY_DN20531_c0_g2~~TRINITY_DN20531_c0_g2_i1.p1  ORF type:complete len:442 (+),score=52.91 TRINITY_DN20531_c0_g2_i1:35-1327(+)
MGLLWVAVLWWAVEGRVEVLDGAGRVNVSLASVPVPFHGRRVVNGSRGVLVTPEYLQAIRFNFSFPYILLFDVINVNLMVNTNIYAAHALAIIQAPIYVNYPGRDYFYYLDPPLVSPVVELIKDDYSYLTKLASRSNWTLIVNVTPEGENQWIKAFSSPQWLFAQCLVSLLSLIGMVGSIYCLYCAKKEYIELSHVILCLEFISNTIRLIWWSVDPVFSRLKFPYLLGNILETVTVPFTVSTSLMVAMFWFHLFHSKNMKLGLHSHLIQKIFTCLIVFVFLVEAVEVTCRIFYRSYVAFNILFQTIKLVYLGFHLLIYAFYVYTGVSTIKYLSKSKGIGHHNSHKELILKIQKIVIAICIAYFLMTISIILMISPLYNTLIGYQFIWPFSTISMILLSYTHIAAFWPKKKVSTLSKVTTPPKLHVHVNIV